MKENALALGGVSVIRAAGEITQDERAMRPYSLPLRHPHSLPLASNSS
jgi:hypothetical protein